MESYQASRMELETPKNGFCESCYLLTLSQGAGE